MHAPRSLYTRRSLLRAGARTTLAATLAASALPPEAYAIDWGSLFGERMPDISGIVKELTGAAFADDEPLQVGSRVPSGARVRVDSGGRAAIALEDGSIFTVFGGTSLELLLNKMSEGILNLLAGAVLLVVNSGGRYLVAGSTASFGIKGTVVYRQTFSPEEHMGQTMDGLVRIPAGYTDYFCTCHGQTEFLLSGRTTPYAHTDAQYHEAYYVNPAYPTRRLAAPMMNHTDGEIRHLVSLQEGKKHDISWLRH